MTKSLWLLSWKNCFTGTPDITGKAFLGELRSKKGLERLIPSHVSHVILHVVSVKGDFCKWVVGIKMCERVRNSNTVLKEVEKTLLFYSLSQLSCRNYDKEKHGWHFSWLLQNSPILRGKLPAGVNWPEASLLTHTHWRLEHTNILNEALIR